LTSLDSASTVWLGRAVMSREEANRIVRAAERVRRMRHVGLKLALPTAAALGAGAAFAIGAIPATTARSLVAT
jgi:hypothetical protein